MKNFFKKLLKVYLFVGFVEIVVLTISFFSSWSFTRGQSSMLFAPSGVEILVVDEVKGVSLQEVKMPHILNYHEYMASQNLILGRINLIYRPFQVGHVVPSENYVAAPISQNGSFIVLSFTAVTNIVLLGWIFYIALICTYKGEIIKDIKKVKALFKKQV